MTTPAHGTRCARVSFWSARYGRLAASFYLVVFALVVACGLTPFAVSAQTCPPNVSHTDDDEGTASAHCESSRSAQTACHAACVSGAEFMCNRQFVCQFAPISTGTFAGGGSYNMNLINATTQVFVSHFETHTYMGSKKCSDRSDSSSTFPFVDGGSTCTAGCTELHFDNHDGTTSGEYTGDVCREDDPCPSGFISFQPAGQTFKQCIPPPPDDDGDGFSNADDAFPGDPTEHADSDHDGVGDNADKFSDNPNESKDSDNDGTGDNGDFNPNNPDNGKDDGSGNESDNRSTGGGNCNTPPQSSGDAILGQIAYQAWATRCAVERQNGTSTNSPGKDQGDAKSGTPGTGTGSGSGTGLGDLTWHDGGQPDFGREGDGDGESAFGSDDGLLDAVDSTGFGLSRSCPTIPTPTFMGHAVELPIDMLCDSFAILAAFILLGGFVQAAYIIGQG